MKEGKEKKKKKKKKDVYKYGKDPYGNAYIPVDQQQEIQKLIWEKRLGKQGNWEDINIW